MCDCYMLKCHGCHNEISIHVADFCTPRENVKVYCPDCLSNIPTVDSQDMSIFICKIEEKEDIWEDGKPRRRYVGKNVIFIVNDIRAYGICLN